MEFLEDLRSWKESTENRPRIYSQNVPLRADLGYNSDAIRIEKSISCQSGNTRGRNDRNRREIAMREKTQNIVNYAQTSLRFNTAVDFISWRNNK